MPEAHRPGVNDNYVRVAEEVPAVASIKVEAVPTPEKIGALARGLKGRRVSLLGGLGGVYSFFELERGTAGLMTGFAFPEALRQRVEATRAGNSREALEVYRLFLPLMVFEHQGGIAVRKAVYNLRGVLRHARTRAPGGGLDRHAQERLERLIRQTVGDADIRRPLPI